ncbi:DEAD/DEAH box helicase [Rhodospirillum rubrum]|uniref:DEAD/DEAH box helicase n=1 Tax=Rhodospirillum rubrum TaxID=1085 RepID=UPI001908C1C4|nr:DEAD/DEAH box helicase [Rhodospirillum rubrum]MBK1664949.1 DEAD/DEAH box helicase [Rhodospirillum rubrum]MBK1677215.1 DEAD/DEAH box helicase [Rhodospirillum rubrum]
MTFADLGLSPETLRAIEEVGYTTPTPIQVQAIPYVQMGRDVLGIAQTGTGKTASFTLPMIDILASGKAKARMPRSLILAPTRELATQVSENFTLYGKYQKLSMALLIGGESMNEQQKVLDRGVDVLIATPGRLIDLFERGSILLRDVKVLVIDEADRMLDMGFIPDVERIVALLPKIRQTLFFSATMDKEIRRLADAFLMNPKEVRIEPTQKVAETVEQALIMVKASEKREALRQLLHRETVTNAFIFCNRKRDVDVLYKSLSGHGFDILALHGDMPQYVRTERLEKFKRAEVQLMVCSDVAARGIDVTEVSHVFNFDVPTHPEDYIHRIGRTGRAGRLGRAYTLATPEDAKYLRAIENLLGKTIPPDPQLELSDVAVEDVAPVVAEDDRRPKRGDKGRPERGARRSGRGSADAERTRPLAPERAANDQAPVERPVVEKTVVDQPAAERAPVERVASERTNERASSERTSERASSDRNGDDRGRGSRGRDDRSAARGRRPRRWEDDPQSEVMEMRISDDVIGFGGFTPAFLLVPSVPFSDPDELDREALAEEALADAGLLVEAEEPENDSDFIAAPGLATREIETSPKAPVAAEKPTREKADREKPKRKRGGRRTKGATDGADAAPMAETVAPTTEGAETVAPTTEGAEAVAEPLSDTVAPIAAEAPGAEAVVDTQPVEAAPEKPKRKRAAPRKKPEAVGAATDEAASPEAEAPAEKPKRKRAAPRKKAEAVGAEGNETVAVVAEKPKRKRAAPRKKAEAPKAETEAEVAAPTEPRED